MRKGEKIIFAIVTIALSTLTLASAQYYGGGFNLAQGSSQIINWIEQIIGPFAYALFGSPEYLFEKILLLVVMMAVIYKALTSPIIPGGKVFTDKKGVVWIITIAVSVLGTRFLTESQWISFIILPYTALGVVLGAGIPFIIMFFFAQSFESSVVRKSLWILFAVVFMGIWMSRYDEVGSIGWIYFITSLVALIFFFADGTIRRVIVSMERKSLEVSQKDQHIAKLTAELTELIAIEGKLEPSRYRRMKRDLEQRMKNARKI